MSDDVSSQSVRPGDTVWIPATVSFADDYSVVINQVVPVSMHRLEDVHTQPPAGPRPAADDQIHPVPVSKPVIGLAQTVKFATMHPTEITSEHFNVRSDSSDHAPVSGDQGGQSGRSPDGSDPARRWIVYRKVKNGDRSTRKIIVEPDVRRPVGPDDVRWIRDVLRAAIDPGRRNDATDPDNRKLSDAETESMTDLERMIARAIDDPGSFVPRRRGYRDMCRPEWPGVPPETVLRWQTRAVVTVMLRALGTIGG